MSIFKDADFEVLWDCSNQEYTVFYKEKFLIKSFRYADIKCYTSSI